MKLSGIILGLLASLARVFGEDNSSATPITVSAEPLAKGQRIVAAHHSYFRGLPPLIDEMAKAAHLDGHLFVSAWYIGGAKSLQHWDIRDEVNKTKNVLTAGSADVLVLTPVYLPDEGIEKFARLGLEHNPDLRVTVQELWLPFDEYQPHYYDPPKIPAPAQVDHNAQTGASLRAMHRRYFDEMDAHLREINAKLGRQALFVVPSGQAVIALREKILAGEAPGLKTQEDLFADPLGHPKPVLQALIAYVHYAVIYRRNPAGLPVPKALDDLNLSRDKAVKLNRLLQELAWDEVLRHPLSGVVAAGSERR
jgi:hypothetical protein